MRKYEKVELELMLVADVIRTSRGGDDYSTDTDWDD